jgi:hypothetical protein
LLLADLSFQRLDPPCRIRWPRCAWRHRQRGFRPLQPARTASPAQTSLTADRKGIPPAVQQLALDLQLLRQAVDIVRLRHPLQRGQLEIPRETTPSPFRHTCSPL